jgi:hypothetical protein
MITDDGRRRIDIAAQFGGGNPLTLSLTLISGVAKLRAL